MKLNISYPATGLQKTIDIQDETKVRCFYDKRISQEVAGDPIGDEFKGYVFRITGGNDKQGFCMTQGVLRHDRTRILMKKGFPGYRQRRAGERKRKSARGCIVDSTLSVLNLLVVKKGENDIAGVTDGLAARRLGPKRASKIRKLFALSKEDDVRKYVNTYRRTVQPKKEGKATYTKAPKIQRLITPRQIQRKRALKAFHKSRTDKATAEASAYAKLLAKRVQEAKQRKVERRRATSSRHSVSSEQ